MTIIFRIFAFIIMTLSNAYPMIGNDPDECCFSSKQELFLYLRQLQEIGYPVCFGCFDENISGLHFSGVDDHSLACQYNAWSTQKRHSWITSKTAPANNAAQQPIAQPAVTAQTADTITINDAAHDDDNSCTETISNISVEAESISIDDEDYAFVCSYVGCDKSFTRKVNLIHHEKSHKQGNASEKEYVCDEPGCNKKFERHDYLIEHLVVHTGKRPYRCTEPGCKQKFRFRAELSTHRMKHYPQGVYNCQHCSKVFRTQRGLKNHVKRSHKNNGQQTKDKD